MQKMTLIAVSSLLSLVGAAHANTKQDVMACKAAVADEVAGEGAQLKVKSIRGSSLKRITIMVNTADGQETMLCSVKRGEVRDIESL